MTLCESSEVPSQQNAAHLLQKQLHNQPAEIERRDEILQQHVCSILL